MEESMIARINHFLDLAMAYMTWVSRGVVVFLWLSINYEVIMRYLFNRPTSWVTDLTVYLIPFIVFFSTGWLLGKDGHIKIELLGNVLSPKILNAMNVITSIIGIFVCIIFFGYSMKDTLDAIREKELIVQAIILPKWPVLMLLPIGFFCLILQFIRRAVYFALEGKLPDRR
jgi:C4-dicarboxylate transporter DctQ subunit